MSAFDLDQAGRQWSAVSPTPAASWQGAQTGEGEPRAGAGRPSLGAEDELANDLPSLRDRARQTSRQLARQPLAIANHDSHLILKLLGG